MSNAIAPVSNESLLNAMREHKVSMKPGVKQPEDAPTAKLTFADAVNILAAKGKQPAADLARSYGVSVGSIYKIWQGRTWVEAQKLIG